MEQADPQLKRYLLGDLTDDARAELDLMLLTAADFATAVDLAEEDLIEEYLDRELTADDVTRFETHFLLAPERRHQLAVSRELREISREASVAAVPAAPSFFERFAASLTMGRTLVYAAGLLIVAGVAVIYFLSGGRGQLQKEYEALNRQDLSDTTPYRDMSGISLLPGSLRGGDAAVHLTSTPGDRVFVRLALPIEFREKTDLHLRLMRENTESIAFDRLRTYDSGSGKEIRLLLPAKILGKGAYRIEVSAADNAASPIVYAFTVD